MPSVNLITLGCPKNTVDSERMHRLLECNDYEVADEPDDADIIVVNTCGFIEPAKEESIATALEAADYKDAGQVQGSDTYSGVWLNVIETSLKRKSPRPTWSSAWPANARSSPIATGCWVSRAPESTATRARGIFSRPITGPTCASRTAATGPARSLRHSRHTRREPQRIHRGSWWPKPGVWPRAA